MNTSLLRSTALILASGLLATGTLAQEPKRKTSDTETKPLRLLKAPETPAELWDAVKFSLNVGQTREALGYLERLLAGDIPADLLIEIRERDATTFFPKLTAAPELFEKAAVLIRRADKAAQDRARDPERIRKFIGYLTRTAEHRAYGIAQLRSAGADAVPYLLSALRDPSLAEYHSTILLAMQRLDTSTVPPLVAALGTDNHALLANVIAVLSVLGKRDTVPHLRYVAEAPEMPPTIKAAARSAVEQILGTGYGSLPSAADSLTAQAARYYQHQVDLGLSAANTVRLWLSVAGGGLKDQEVSPSYAEEYFGLLHARRALALSPNHEAAQIMLLSLALEKESERARIEQPLPDGPGRISAQALAAGPALLSKVLTKAMDEGHPAVALAATRTLAQIGDIHLLTGQVGRPSPLVQALTTPDRRIQFAAAEAVLNFRPQKPYPGTSLVVPILARALATEGAPKALLIDYDTTRGTAMSSLLREAGYEAQYASNAREGFTVAAESADFEMIFIEPNIQDPTISPALASFRNDPRTVGIPIFVLGELAQQTELSKFERRYPRVRFFLRPTKLETLKLQLDPLLAELQSRPLTTAERSEYARRAVAWLARVARGEIRGLDPRSAEPALVRVLDDEALGPDAIAAASLLPSAKAQTALAELVLNESAPMLLRLKAAQDIKQSSRQFGALLTSTTMADLLGLLDRTADPALHQAIAGVIGGLNSRSVDAGQRLRRYATPPIEAAQAPGQPTPQVSKP
ncbi:MAG: hypothetical protein HY000_35695 [Planctomycetes bacterium]|nr:hypothetical protein [Planctomycetota bacterium]